MTDVEIQQLARDLVQNTVFMSDRLRHTEDITMVFPILSLMKQENIDKMKTDKIVHLWEYLREAGPRSCNGYPMFLSCRMINEEDYAKVRAEEKRMRKAIGDVPQEGV